MRRLDGLPHYRPRDATHQPLKGAKPQWLTILEEPRLRAGFERCGKQSRLE
jgi:hypothetical protein